MPAPTLSGPENEILFVGSTPVVVDPGTLTGGFPAGQDVPAHSAVTGQLETLVFRRRWTRGRNDGIHAFPGLDRFSGDSVEPGPGIFGQMPSDLLRMAGTAGLDVFAAIAAAASSSLILSSVRRLFHA